MTQKAYTAGWFHSGDLGYKDEDGYFYIVYHLKDLIITDGENVYPAEVERVIAENDDIFGNAVVGFPDERWGETIVAVVQPRPGATITIDALSAHCERHLVVVDEILRNSAGKIDKIGLRRLVEEELTQRAGSAV